MAHGAISLPLARARHSTTAPPLRLRLHDAHHVEWCLSVPVPARGRRWYAIEATLEHPSRGAARTPWALLSTQVRLDAQGDGATVEDPSIALLRRAAASVTKLLAQARAGFEAERMTTAWLDAAVRVAREARAKLTQAPN